MKVLTSEQIERLKNTAWDGLKVIPGDDGVVMVEQFRSAGDPLLTQREMKERVREIFPDKGIKIHANVWEFDSDTVDIEWIRSNMNDLGLKAKDLVRQTEISASNISLILNGKVRLTKGVKAMFYYFFLSYRLSQKLQENSKIFQEKVVELLHLEE